MAKPGIAALRCAQDKLKPLNRIRLPNAGGGGDVLPKKQDVEDKPHQWRVFCGQGLFNWKDKNGLLLPGGIALNFQVSGTGDEVQKFEAGIFWDTGWSLMLHSEAAHKEWPIHAKTHFQFGAQNPSQPPPFVDWRLPITSDVFEWLEYLAAMLTRTK